MRKKNNVQLRWFDPLTNLEIEKLGIKNEKKMTI